MHPCITREAKLLVRDFLVLLVKSANEEILHSVDHEIVPG